MSIPTVISAPRCASPHGRRAARTSDQRRIAARTASWRSPFVAHGAAVVGAGVAVEVGEATACLLDEHEQRREIPDLEPVRLDRDVDRTLGHERVLPEVAEAPAPPAAPGEREELVGESGGVERRDAVVGEVRVLDRADAARPGSAHRRGTRRRPGSPTTGARAPGRRRGRARARRRSRARSASRTPGCPARSSWCRRSDRRSTRRPEPPPVSGNSSPTTASSGRAPASARPDRLLDEPIGLAHRRHVGLRLDHQIGGPEARERDRIGRVGELGARARDLRRGSVPSPNTTIPIVGRSAHAPPGGGNGRRDARRRDRPDDRCTRPIPSRVRASSASRSTASATS